MPIPPDESHPVDTSSGPSSQTPAAAGVPQNVIDKFQQLGEEAAAEEQDDDDAGAEDEAGDDDEEDENGLGRAAGDSSNKKKKKKKKKKGKAGRAVDRLKEIASGSAPQQVVDAVRNEMDGGGKEVTDEEIKKALRAVDLMKLLDGQVALGNKSNTKALGEHKFWNTQPVPQTLSASIAGNAPVEDVTEEGPIDPIKTPQEVRQEPLPLPSGFEWTQIDITNEEQCKEVYVLLSENYVEDDDASLRFRYSAEFLHWSLTAPGYVPDWHIGVRVAKTGKLVAFISGIKVEIRVRAKSFDAAEINFLCVHKKLRSKRLAPVLIKEVTRRCNLVDIWQAIYTAGVVLPTPFSAARYYHRSLNPVKLVDIGFSPLGRNQTITRLVKQCAVPPHTQTPGLREMVKADVPQVGTLLRKYLARFDIYQTFSKDEEIEHWFLSGQGVNESGMRVKQVTWAYVIEDPTTHLITDLVSFYSLPSSIMNHKKYDVLEAAYLFYYASDAIFSPCGSSDDAATHEVKAKQKLGERLNALMGDLLILAKNAGFDVVNALTILDNNTFLDDQKFGGGNGFLVSRSN
ncbi:Myristoyl-CoA:protein N-myristoyltransferase, N-terminal domain-domain-containing protein [Kockovaella imperatae]|uniref:Glycylpeptide N-tetradecanoyltransferase n=1 Tax=Kockovaella imperatae TaxID=4999 RepID=A0A1Y1UG42_9TREE|nr:Myristoyl-CoA:protein N-myristoyltransferase, N-terminal domain-domain-containing protein [Kockovaella imperatae]ORX37031.1 Myristoyl-CoA:protein N-myristoyltransferase, N-terminal domain-domain-containing protein [Kockovaella imperatae]